MLLLSSKHTEYIREHGEREYPYECCGLLIGNFSEEAKTVCETLPISNAREDSARRTRFLIQPEELLRGEKYAAQKGLDVIGFYHSHPDHPARPSQYDLEHAWPVYSYIVVAVHTGRAQDLRSWELQPDRNAFNEEDIQKGDSTCQ